MPAQEPVAAVCFSSAARLVSETGAPWGNVMKFSFIEKAFVGCIVAGWATWGSIQIGNALVKPAELTTAGFPVEVTETAPSAASAAPEPEFDVVAALATADLDKGAKVFKKCGACHTSEQGGAHKVGPNLWNIVNREKGSADGYNYSKGLLAAGGEWTYDNLNSFLANTKGYAPGTKMQFVLKKPADRANVIAYMRTLSGSPAPLPQ